MSETPADPTSTSTIENRVFVLILQHPQERHELWATAAATAAALRRSRLAVGLSWPNLSRALGRATDPKRWAVLYLGSAQAAALVPPGGVAVLNRRGEPLRDATPVLRGLNGIVLLDGTWSQAKTLWWRNPWLLKLHRLVLNPAQPARLDRLRREPRKEALSTIEAAALALRHLEGGSRAEALLTALDRLIAAGGDATEPAPDHKVPFARFARRWR